MRQAGTGTKERIEQCAVKEFMKNGFNGASLRQIVKDAGVTTGAFYKYYPTKEALFEGLVKSCADFLYALFDRNYEQYTKQDLSGQIQNLNDNSEDLIGQMVDYIYSHMDAMKLILTASEGTPYEHFVHNLAQKEAQSSILFSKILKENGVPVPDLDEEFAHMAASGLVSASFEIILHDMKKEDADRRLRLLIRFYTAGWEDFFGIRFGEKSFSETAGKADAGKPQGRGSARHGTK